MGFPMTLSPLMRNFASVAIVLVAAWTIHAEENQRLSVADAIAAATEPIPAAKEYHLPEKQLRAIEWLRKVPASQREEKAIVDALQALRKSPDGNVAHSATMTLGARNHREFIPQFFAEIETAPNNVRAFFFLMPERHKDPPIAQLREALNSQNPDARKVAVELVEWTKAMELQPLVEKLVVSDPSDRVREEAATQLWLLGSKESVPALRAALHGNTEVQKVVAFALAHLGGDAEVELLLPFLKSSDAGKRTLMTKGLGAMQLKDPKPVVDALLPLLSDPSIEVRIAAIESSGRLKESRAVTGIRATVTGGFKIPWEDRFKLVDALASIGNEAAADVLNEMLWLGYGHNFRLEAALTKLGFVSSGREIWEAYLVDPIRSNPGSDVSTRGYFDALPVLAKCADIELFRAIRLRAARTTELDEKASLDRLSKMLAQRFPEAANEPIETVKSSLPTAASDRDGDGVPDRVDKFPDDSKQH